MLKLKQFVDEAKRKYSVADLVTDHSLVLFILESPHKEEIKFNVPLAGLSGRSMAKELFENPNILPMGKYLKILQKERSKTIFGIVNVSPFPLQRSAYPDQTFVNQYEEELSVAESVRTSSAQSFKDVNKAEFQELLLTDFENRLFSHIKEGSVVVPCGKFAAKYVDALQIDHNHVKVIEGVPHPSYNSWSRSKYKDVIQVIKDEAVQITTQRSS